MQADPALSHAPGASARAMVGPAAGSSVASPDLSAAGVRRVAVFGALAMLLLAALTAWQLYRQVVVKREADAGGEAQILQEHAEKVVGGHFASLRQLEWLVRDIGWEAATQSRLLHERMRAMKEARPEVQSVWLFDETGGVKATSIGYPAPSMNFADRDFFQAPKRGEERFVGQVVLGRITREYSFNLAERVADDDGRFLGVLVISLHPEYFRSFYGRIVEGGDTGMLLRADGGLLARHPQPQGDPLTLRAPAELLKRLSAAPAGELRASAAFEPREFLHAYRRLPDLPL
jgi:two-component system, NtrC family, sensor kinase